MTRFSITSERKKLTIERTPLTQQRYCIWCCSNLQKLISLSFSLSSLNVHVWVFLYSYSEVGLHQTKEKTGTYSRYDLELFECLLRILFRGMIRWESIFYLLPSQFPTFLPLSLSLLFSFSVSLSLSFHHSMHFVTNTRFTLDHKVCLTVCVFILSHTRSKNSISQERKCYKCIYVCVGLDFYRLSFSIFSPQV